MLIDWFTVGAQALNFIILVWLMKRFLYQPILNAIDAREKLVAAELADADAQRADAKKEREDFQHKNAEFDRQRVQELARMADAVAAERTRLLDEARRAADALSSKLRDALIADAHNLDQAIADRVQAEVFAIARKALADLAATDLEERFVATFARRLREADAPTKAALAEAIKAATSPVLVHSAFDLPEDQRAAIRNAINETFSADVAIRFEAAPELIGGISLTTNGQKLEWNIAAYITSLQDGVGALLDTQPTPKQP